MRDTTTLSVQTHKFTVYTYATARENNLIQQAYFRGSKVEIVGQEPKFSEFNPNVQYEVKLEMIRQMILDMDGTTTEIVERCEALPSEQFDELTAALDAIVSKKKS